MKRRLTVMSFFILFAALCLISLPEKHNITLRNRCAEEIGKLWKINSWLAETFQKRKREEEKALKNTTGQYAIGKVLFRAFNSYNSCLWIDVGSENQLVAKNSPVLSGDSVVGLVEYVGKKASLVRLITDSAITPSVRVARYVPDKKLDKAFHTILQALVQHRIPFSSENEEKAIRWLLEKLSNECQVSKEPLFLAKGIVQGYGETLFRAPKPFLKGSGFNYDFNDKEGPARDLRTGEPFDLQQEYPQSPSYPLVQVGDLLVTTGMDGIFPKGLKVAYVDSIFPLSEGAYTYDLIATPTAENLLDLEYVTILPSLGFSPSELPQRIDRILQQIDDAP